MSEASGRQAGTQDQGIEVTPAMIEAGVQCYLEHCPDSGVGDRLDRRMVAEIFTMMDRARRVIPPT